MVLVKILGLVDICAAVVLLSLIFGFDVMIQFLLFPAGLLLVKGLFVFTGDVLSVVDVFASLVLIVSIFFIPPVIFLWIFALLLLAKGMVSFI